MKYDGDIKALQTLLVEHEIMGGVIVGEDKLMLAVTEKRTKEEIDKLIDLVKEVAL